MNARACVRAAVFVLLVFVAAGFGAGATVRDAGAAGDVQGDVDCSGVVDSIDALQVLRSVASLPVSADCLAQAADVDCSTQADSIDGLLILRFVASLPVTTPAGCTPVGDPMGGATATVTLSWGADVDLELFVLPQPASNFDGVLDQYGQPGWYGAMEYQCMQPSPRSAVVERVPAEAHYIAVKLATPCPNGPYLAPFTITIQYADGRVDVESGDVMWGRRETEFVAYGPYDFAPE